VRILTWNLWWRHGPWERRLDAIAATLAELEPDVCGLQEVWAAGEANLAAELAGRLGLNWCYSAAARVRPGGASVAPATGPDRDGGRDGGGLTIGNAVLSRWPIVRHAEARLPTAEAAEGRVAVHARIEAPGGYLPMFTTHLSYAPGGSAIRVAQVRRLAEFVAEETADCAYPPVVTGDLNAEPESDEVRLLGGTLTAPAVRGLVLVDAWRYAGPGDPGHTWSRRNGYLADTVFPEARIDYVLVGLATSDRGRVLGTRLAGAEPVDGVWPSDHFAVVTELLT
jgi:endonuclease/exonuclease/phosphatase family metal-dependent hydrolase